ncbi:MAG: hypothetical protein AB7R89_30810 [Dehalococcoidia bacterium]
MPDRAYGVADGTGVARTGRTRVSVPAGGAALPEVGPEAVDCNVVGPEAGRGVGDGVGVVRAEDVVAEDAEPAGDAVGDGVIVVEAAGETALDDTVRPVAGNGLGVGDGLGMSELLPADVWLDDAAVLDVALDDGDALATGLAVGAADCCID